MAQDIEPQCNTNLSQVGHWCRRNVNSFYAKHVTPFHCCKQVLDFQEEGAWPVPLAEVWPFPESGGAASLSRRNSASISRNSSNLSTRFTHLPAVVIPRHNNQPAATHSSLLPNCIPCNESRLAPQYGHYIQLSLPDSNHPKSVHIICDMLQSGVGTGGLARFCDGRP